MRKEGNFKDKCRMKFSEERKPYKSKEEPKSKDIVYYECKRLGHIKSYYQLHKKKKEKYEIKHSLKGYQLKFH